MGRNVNAEWPESLLLSQSGILQAVVFGEGKPFLTAIIYVNSTLNKQSLTLLINNVNQQLPDYARIKKWHCIAKPLSAQQGLLTTNNRPKRQAISRHYHHVFEQFYRLGEVINE